MAKRAGAQSAALGAPDGPAQPLLRHVPTSCKGQARTGRTRKQVGIKLQPVTHARCSETSVQLGGEARATSRVLRPGSSRGRRQHVPAPAGLHQDQAPHRKMVTDPTPPCDRCRSIQYIRGNALHDHRTAKMCREVNAVEIWEPCTKPLSRNVGVNPGSALPN